VPDRYRLASAIQRGGPIQTELAQRIDVDLGRMWRVVSAQRGDFVEGFSKPLWSAILAAILVRMVD